MAKKRYQVFLSSTYEDLKDERFAVMESLQTIKCFVAGMEYFSAVDMNQFEYIKKVIDDCDYYLLVLGGRYGTVPKGEEKSYTEKEYDYAVAKNKPIIALLHQDISNLPSGKCEQPEIQKKRYAAFRDKLSQGRLVNYWRDISELRAKALSGVVAAIENFPDVPGWVRGDSTASEDLLREINALRKENEELKHVPKSPECICIERLKRKYNINFMYMNEEGKIINDTVETSLFLILKLSIDIFNRGTKKEETFVIMKAIISDIVLNKREDLSMNRCAINDKQTNDIIKNFLILNLIHLNGGIEINNIETNSPYYSLTEFGKKIAPEVLFD